MKQRITERDLEHLARRINVATGSPLQPYAKNEAGQLRACVGCYLLGFAYGGARLERIAGPSGEVSTPLGHGFKSKRDLHAAMCAYLARPEITKSN